MAWGNVEVKSVEKVKDIRLDVGAAKADMEDRIEEIKRNIRMSGTYERWADNLENGMHDVIALFFNVIGIAMPMAGCHTLLINVARIYECSGKGNKKELIEAEGSCERLVKEYLEDLTAIGLTDEAGYLKILIQNKNIFKTFTDAVCWMVDEAYNKTRQMDISNEQLWNIILRKISRYATNVLSGGKKSGIIDSIVTGLDDSMLEHSLRSLLFRQEAWGRMRQQKLIR